jgi:hypothetical protein
MTIKWLAIPIMTLAACMLSYSPSKAYAAAPQDNRGYVQDQRGWDAPPSEFRDVQRQGFHDGIEAAHRDFDRHRRADADDHEEYRHPHVDHAVRNDYREGFRRGYDVAKHHLMEHSGE